MTDKTKEVLRLALMALEYIDLTDNDRDFLQPHECYMLDEAITAIRKALAEESLGTEQPAQPQTDQSVTPEYLEWLDSIQPRHGVGGNEAWNAGVAWAKAQPQQEPVAHEQHQCKFPMCHNEEYQQALAEQIKQELYTGGPAQRKPWVGLEPEDFFGVIKSNAFEAGAYWANNKLREKNT